MKEELIQRFTTYVQVDTQSDASSTACPTTPGQWTLGRMLVEELQAIGMEDVTIDANGYVMATLPATTDTAVPVIGFLAHLDTATDFTGAGVKPQVVEAYDGGDMVLNAEQQIVLSPRDFPELSDYKGHTLITTDGTTLLGADDKAGDRRDYDGHARLDSQSRHPARQSPGSLHAGRGDRAGSPPVRRGRLRSRIRVHGGRWTARRAAVREL